MSNDTSGQITFPAQVARIQTLADGGIRVTFDLPEDAVLAAAQLMECKRLGIAGVVKFEPIVKQTVTNGESKLETRRSEWQPKG